MTLFGKFGIIIIVNIKSKKLSYNYHLNPLKKDLMTRYGCSSVKFYHRRNKYSSLFLYIKVITNNWKCTWDYLLTRYNISFPEIPVVEIINGNDVTKTFTYRIKLL